MSRTKMLLSLVVSLCFVLNVAVLDYALALSPGLVSGNRTDAEGIKQDVIGMALKKKDRTKPLTLDALRQMKAYPDRFVERDGLSLLVPVNSLSEPLEPRTINGVTLPKKIDSAKLRNQDDILAFLEKCSPEVVGMQRFIDVGGSSIDLRALIKFTTQAGINLLDLIPSTTIVAGDFPLSLRIGLAGDVNDIKARDVIQYVIDYKKWEGGEIVDKTQTYTVVRSGGTIYTLMEDGSLRQLIADKDGTYEIWGEKGASRMQKREAGQVIDGQMGAFAYFMSKIGAFGVRGNFRTLQPIAEAGGLGRSGSSNAMIISMAGVIAGAELTKADVQAEAIEKEGNGEDDALSILGGYTGGQESGVTLLGGASQMIHLTEIKDAAGNYVWPVGTELVVSLAGSLEEVNQRILSRVALVQAGLPFENGVATIKRTASGINTAWCARAKYSEDIEGRKLHSAKIFVAMVAAYGVTHGRWDLVVWSQNEHRRIRNELDKGFYEFAIQALENKPDRPAFADRYLQILQTDKILNRYLQWHINGRDDKGNPFDLRKVSLYSMTQEPLIEEVARIARKITGKADMKLTDLDSPAAVFIPGAGGTGSPAVIIAKTPELLKQILEEVRLENDQGQRVKLEQFDSTNVLKVMGDTGLLQGYLRPKAGKAIEFNNLPEGTTPLKEGYPGVYDQKTGIFYITAEASKVPSEILVLPRIAFLSEHPEIREAIARQKRSGSRETGMASSEVPLLAIMQDYAATNDLDATLTSDDQQRAFYAAGMFDVSNMEIFMPAGIKLTQPIMDYFERIRARFGDDVMRIRPYSGAEHLSQMLKKKSAGVKRVVITESAAATDIAPIVAGNPKIFANVRLYNVELPKDYATMGKDTETIFQSKMLNIAILIRLFEKNKTPMIEALLREYISNALGQERETTEEFIAMLQESPDESVNAESVTKRINYFLGKVVRLTEILARELKFMRVFLTAA